MHGAGLTPDQGCYGIAIAACHEAGEWGCVRELLYDMRKRRVITPETMLPFHKNLWQKVPIDTSPSYSSSPSPQLQP